MAQTPKYKAVQSQYEALAGALDANLTAKTSLLRKFKTKGWYNSPDDPTSDRLIDVALDKIKADVKHYDEFIGMLESVPELSHITKKITDQQAPAVTPAVVAAPVAPPSSSFGGQSDIAVSVDNRILTEEEHFSDVKSAVVSVLSRWQFIAKVLLGIQSMIGGANTPNQKEECMDDDICTWLRRAYDEQKYGPPTWKTLILAIADRNGGNNPARAREIARDHQES